MTEDLYELLGVDREARADTIKAAYRRLARSAHPDAGGDPDRFVAITMAYNTLMDPKLRKAYDLTGAYGDENALAVQHRVIAQIAGMLERIIERVDVPLEEFDIVGAMSAHLDAIEPGLLEEAMRIGKILAGLHKTNRLIRRKGEGRNLFSEIVSANVIKRAAEYDVVTQQLGDLRRVREELTRYQSIVEIIRTVQAGAYSAPGNAPPGFLQFFNLARFS